MMLCLRQPRLYQHTFCQHSRMYPCITDPVCPLGQALRNNYAKSTGKVHRPTTADRKFTIAYAFFPFPFLTKLNTEPLWLGLRRLGHIKYTSVYDESGHFRSTILRHTTKHNTFVALSWGDNSTTYNTILRHTILETLHLKLQDTLHKDHNPKTQNNELGNAVL